MAVETRRFHLRWQRRPLDSGTCKTFGPDAPFSRVFAREIGMSSQVALAQRPAQHYAVSMPPRFPLAGDRRLIQIVDAALDDTARKSGDWLVCRQGCTQCCIGVFAINQLDAWRLQRGLAALAKRAPERAEAVKSRARDAVARLAHEFPGNPVSGILDDGDEAEER